MSFKQALLRGFHIVTVAGPATGIAVGVAQTAGSLFVWLAHGKPNYYFADWSTVYGWFILLCVGGAWVGIPYGIALCLIERLFSRRTRFGRAGGGLVSLAFVSSFVITSVEFHRKIVFQWDWLQQLGAACMGLAISFRTARRIT